MRRRKPPPTVDGFRVVGPNSPDFIQCSQGFVKPFQCQVTGAQVLVGHLPAAGYRLSHELLQSGNGFFPSFIAHHCQTVKVRDGRDVNSREL